MNGGLGRFGGRRRLPVQRRRKLDVTFDPRAEAAATNQRKHEDIAHVAPIGQHLPGERKGKRGWAKWVGIGEPKWKRGVEAWKRGSGSG